MIISVTCPDKKINKKIERNTNITSDFIFDTSNELKLSLFFCYERIFEWMYDFKSNVLDAGLEIAV